MPTVSVFIDKELYEKLFYYCKKRNVSMGKIIREALRQYLKRNDKEVV